MRTFIAFVVIVQVISNGRLSGQDLEYCIYQTALR